MDSLNIDELGVIFSFLPPQDLILNVQLVSNNFHQIVSTQDTLWKKYCDEYFLADLFDWENDLFTKSLKIGDNCKYFTLFSEWSKSIPRIELVGRYPTIPSCYNAGAEHERSIFSRFDTSKYSFRNLAQLVIILNVLSLTKNGKEFNTESAEQNYEDDTLSGCYPFDSQLVNAKFTPYDFVPSIWRDSLTITLSDDTDPEFTYGYATIKNDDKDITKEIPFGAFCLMILSPNQEEKISLLLKEVKKQFTESEIYEGELGVTASTEVCYPVCFFNRMHKWFTEEMLHWRDDKDCYPDETWLPSERSGFLTEYEFHENTELKKVTMKRKYFYP